MSIQVKSMAVMEAGGDFVPYTFELPEELPAGMVDIEVHYCGLCHSDISLKNDEWGNNAGMYPFVGGHEIIGAIARSSDPNVKVGTLVGVGWSRGNFCKKCKSCQYGDLNLCAQQDQTIIDGNKGGFASHVRVYGDACVPIPANVNPVTAGPTLCGMLTMWTPIREWVKPTSRVGVIGIGGLGQMGVSLLAAIGAEIVAFTSKPEKAEELKKLGVHEIVDSTKPAAIRGAHCDLILSTVNVDLDWSAYLDALNPRGRLHFLGVVPTPVAVHVFQLMPGMKSISSSPSGSVIAAREMLEFCGRNKIEPVCELFPLEKINDAVKKVEDGTIRFRAVLVVKKE